MTQENAPGQTLDERSIAYIGECRRMARLARPQNLAMRSPRTAKSAILSILGQTAAKYAAVPTVFAIVFVALEHFHNWWR